MRPQRRCWGGRLRRDRGGQTLIVVAVSLATLLGLAAFAIDMGRIFSAHRRLQATADAAATAAAQDLPNGTAAIDTAILYSALPGKKNASPDLPGVSMVNGYPQLKCLTSTGIPCSAPGNANALVVKEQVDVPFVFGRAVGLSALHLEATATVSMRGGIPHPIDAMIIVDTTGSMQGTKLEDAKAAVRSFLSSLWPCQQNLTNCGAVTNGHVANPVDEVGLMVFPGLTSSTYVPNEFDCTANISGHIAQYFQSPPPVYLIVSLSSDYRISDTSGLNGSSSKLVKAVDRGDGNTCGSSSTYGLEAVGGAGTYFATVISLAQTTLVNTGRSNSRHVIIFISDGDAEAYAGSPPNPCHTAITNAQNATAQGTAVYSIAYGYPSSGCSNDSPSITPRDTMRQIASDPSKFFDKPSAGSLLTVFQSIVTDLQTTRLLPDGTL